MIEEIFKNMAPNFEKLLQYGFKRFDKEYIYETQIKGGEFTLFVFVNENSSLKTKVLDNNTHDEYIMHLIGGQGNFVGMIRDEIERELIKIKENCYTANIHISKQAREIIDLVKDKFGDELEYLWSNSLTDGIWRRKDNRKWYGLIMTINKSKIIGGENFPVEILDIRIETSEAENLVDNQYFFKGYHINKKHWLTVILDYSVSTNKIMQLIENSYALAKG